MSKQKRFITDAGHEIKTPLTIINANVDILEMELGEDNESLADIKGQANRLQTLTEDLVMLSRMEEAEDHLSKIAFPISEVVSEAAGAFRGLDSLLATVQMPSGIPVATVAVDGATNAAILAAEILSVSDDDLAAKLDEKRKAGAEKVLAKNKALEEQYNG